MKNFRNTVWVVLAIALLPCAAVAQQGSVALIPDADWNILSTDSVRSPAIALYAKTDVNLLGASIPIEVRFNIGSYCSGIPDCPVRWDQHVSRSDHPDWPQDLYFLVSSVDSQFYVDTFIFDAGITAATKTFRRNAIDTLLDPTVHGYGAFNGFLIGLVASAYPNPIFPAGSWIKIGDLYLKAGLGAESAGSMPNDFRLLLEPMKGSPEDGIRRYPPSNYFKFTPASGPSFKPHYNLLDSCNIRVTTDGPWDTEEQSAAIPRSYELAQNYPNPFNPATTISFYVERRSHVELDVFNILGRKVRTLVSGDVDPGWQEVIWDGANSSGDMVASGIYFYRMSAGDFIETRKMVLLK